MTNVRNDHVTICNTQEQVVIGEMIKSILNHKYKGKHFSSEYKEIEPDKLSLVLTWFIVEERQKVSLFMLSEFRISVKFEPTDVGIIIIDLYKILGGLISMLNRYFDNRLLDERRITSNRAESIVSKIIEARNGNGLNDNSSICVKSGPKSYVEPIKQEQKTRLKPEVDSNENSDPEIITIVSESESKILTHAEGVVPEVASDLSSLNSKQNDLTARTERLALSLNPSLLHLLKSEKKFQSPTLVDDSSNLFFYGKPENNMQVICCKDGFTALNLKFALSWHIADAYDVEPSIFIKEDKIYLDDTFLYEKNKKEKRQKNGTFCFAPNTGTTIDDMEKRLRKVNYMFNSAFEKVDDCFRVMYHTSRSAETSSKVLSSMGWSVKVEGISTLVIFTEFNPVASIAKVQNNNTKKEIIKPVKVRRSYNKEIPKNGKESFLHKEKETPKPTEELLKTSLTDELRKVNSLDFIYKFTGDKKEAIEKLHEVYLDQEIFSTFSSANQQRILDVLQKFWIKENPEKYAIKLLEFLED